jgi:hypothetical protein
MNKVAAIAKSSKHPGAQYHCLSILLIMVMASLFLETSRWQGDRVSPKLANLLANTAEYF